MVFRLIAYKNVAITIAIICEKSPLMERSCPSIRAARVVDTATAVLAQPRRAARVAGHAAPIRAGGAVLAPNPADCDIGDADPTRAGGGRATGPTGSAAAVVAARLPRAQPRALGRRTCARGRPALEQLLLLLRRDPHRRTVQAERDLFLFLLFPCRAPTRLDQAGCAKAQPGEPTHQRPARGPGVSSHSAFS